MVRQFLLMAGIVASASAFAATDESKSVNRTPISFESASHIDANRPWVMVEKNEGQARKTPARRVEGSSVHWRRPAGQFWGTGFIPDLGGFYPFTPVVIRPWVEYTFENISTGVSGTPSWSTAYLVDPSTGAYETEQSTGNEVKMSYLQWENCPAPRLSYPNQVPFPTMYYDGKEYESPYNEIAILADSSTEAYYGMNMPVSSHYWSLFTRIPGVEGDGIVTAGGAKTYPGMSVAPFFGTNNGSNNAMATRFEKPDRPYLLNAVHWYYYSGQEIPKNIPLTAYVFKTANDKAIYTAPSGTEFETVQFGELIAVSESFVPASLTNTEGTVVFTFTEKDPVTGAETATSLEIEDDITIVVTGYQVDLGNGGYITSCISLDDIDEGYGNMGFIGNMELTDEGNIAYTLIALKDYFVNGFGGNTTIGVLADVSYPWLLKYYDQPDDIQLPNEQPEDPKAQGLLYPFFFQSSTTTDDFEVTFNGEPECDWLEIVDAGDEMEKSESGEEVFTGQCYLAFQADPNPENVDRTCVIEVTIPAASYTITIRQGSNNTVPDAVEVVTADGNAQYFDLQGRRVANPEKGIYIKKTGNTTKKVIL